LLVLENLTEPLLACLYIPVSEGYRVETDMRAEVWPANVRKDEFGFLTGRVVSAAKFPTTREELTDRLQIDELARVDYRAAEAANPHRADSRSEHRERLSVVHERGPAPALYSGTPCQGRIIVAEQRPIELVFPWMGAW
jgi:HlyD family secretion protein